jgi:hypothetical protein
LKKSFDLIRPYNSRSIDVTSASVSVSGNFGDIGGSSFSKTPLGWCQREGGSVSRLGVRCDVNKIHNISVLRADIDVNWPAMDELHFKAKPDAPQEFHVITMHYQLRFIPRLTAEIGKDENICALMLRL